MSTNKILIRVSIQTGRKTARRRKRWRRERGERRKLGRRSRSRRKARRNCMSSGKPWTSKNKSSSPRNQTKTLGSKFSNIYTV
jgi:hypothetical protein